jgi:hypothetical protein
VSELLSGAQRALPTPWGLFARHRQHSRQAEAPTDCSRPPRTRIILHILLPAKRECLRVRISPNQVRIEPFPPQVLVDQSTVANQDGGSPLNRLPQ